MVRHEKKHANDWLERRAPLVQDEVKSEVIFEILVY